MKFYNTICIYLHFANLSNKYIYMLLYQTFNNDIYLYFKTVFSSYSFIVSLFYLTK